MRLSVIQMDMRLGESAYNFAHAEALLRRAAAEGADTALLPETWNTGFFPADHLPERSDRGGEAVKALCAPLARELNMNIVAGSVSDRRGGRVYNTAYVFDRQGACLAAYDKTHLFTPMGEHEHYAAGDHLTTFSLDGHKCGLLICYDLRFPELFRTLALQGVELLLLPAQWPAARRYHWETLTAARAIENQFFLAACNSCGTAGEPLAPEITREFRRITGLVIHEGFGQSESSVLIGNFPWFDPRPGSLGKPSPLYDIAIFDQNGNECPVGQEGEIVVRNLDKGVPPGLLRGYWSEGGLHRSYGNVYHTNDVAWADENGFYWYVGRNDDVIKCSGYRIGPFEIESVLLTHPAVHEVAITAAPDQIRGQVVCASIVLSEGFEGTDELTRELQTYVKRLTAPYKYPRVVHYVESLPKTVSGKISRAQIRAGATQEQ